MISPQIIYLNGPSSSGKTSLAQELQKRLLPQPFLHIGIDKMIAMMPNSLNDWNGGNAPQGFSWKASLDDNGKTLQEIQLGPFAKKISNTLLEVVKTLANLGHSIIVDDVSFGKKGVQRWKQALSPFEVFWVGVHSPLEVIEKKEKRRGDRIPGSGRHQFFNVHTETEYDLEIDTHELGIEKSAQKILQSFDDQDEKAITIRPIKHEDIQRVPGVFSFPWLSHEEQVKKWKNYFEEDRSGVRSVFILESNDAPLAYANLLYHSKNPEFSTRNIPEINDIWVDEKHRQKGIATCLVRYLEKTALDKGFKTIGLGVGLYKDYGSAQRLYYRLGYTPDGRGITYNNRPVIPGKECCIDDELLLWFTKTIL